MKELKLRAWDRASKRMGIVTEFHYAEPYRHSCFTVQFEDLDQDGKTIYPKVEFTADDVEVMDYIGAEDGFGKEIYEKDIIQFQAADGEVYRAIVFFTENTDNEECDFISGYAISVFANVTEQFAKQIENDEPIEVTIIGDVYRSPEIVKSKDN